MHDNGVINLKHIHNNGVEEVECSKWPTDNEKLISEKMNERLHEEFQDFLNENEIKTIKFDVKETIFGFYAVGYYIISKNEEIQYIKTPIELMVKKVLLSYIRKVGAVVMPKNIPAFVFLFAEDLKEINTKKWSFKAVFSSIIAAISAWLGVGLQNMLLGFFIVAVFDAILGLMPGNVKPGTEKDHKLQAKFFSFVTNVLGIVVILKANEHLRSYFGENYEYIEKFVPFLVISWVFSIYTWRTVNYIARANKAKIPTKIKKKFDDFLK